MSDEGLYRLSLALLYDELRKSWVRFIARRIIFLSIVKPLTFICGDWPIFVGKAC